MPQFVSLASVRTDLDDFTKGYVDCGLWLMQDDNGHSCDDFDGTISDACYARIIEDCTDFVSSNRALLDLANELGRDDEYLGHDFYLTRNGHGTGFWDRGTEDVWRARKTYGAH